MTWLKSRFSWLALNLCTAAIVVFVVTRGESDWSATNPFDPMLESGKWAVRFLLICLAMTPLNSYFGWRSVIKLRKPVGLWAFAFALVHVAYLIREGRLDTFLYLMQQPFIALGVLGLVVLSALALTSNRWAMRHLGKWWKRLHRLVCAAGIAVTTHAVLAATMSKKVMVRDPRFNVEGYVYLAVLVALLAVRLPVLRRIVQAIAVRVRPHEKEIPIVPILPRAPRVLPRTYYRYPPTVLSKEFSRERRAEVLEKEIVTHDN
ncbi:MAG: ferric reductase-like transmembrane domain-containing protein [Chloroflexi bacterium]|nr:ferric reductase-like transmembrane domain-containing protein [Chloroflexota bacterium]